PALSLLAVPLPFAPLFQSAPSPVPMAYAIRAIPREKTVGDSSVLRLSLAQLVWHEQVLLRSFQRGVGVSPAFFPKHAGETPTPLSENHGQQYLSMPHTRELSHAVCVMVKSAPRTEVEQSA